MICYACLNDTDSHTGFCPDCEPTVQHDLEELEYLRARELMDTEARREGWPQPKDEER